MSDQKIPHRSNFLEKFAAVEEVLKNDITPKRQPDKKEETIASNVPNIVTEIPAVEVELTCSQCGTDRNPEDVFCGTCGNRLRGN